MGVRAKANTGRERERIVETGKQTNEQIQRKVKSVLEKHQHN
jgi:hypothetical protein